MSARTTALILMIAGVWGEAGAALAQHRAPPSAAVSHYKTARAHYKEGRYREAIAELEAALALDPGSPTLVYNLARTHELLGELSPAIGYYEQYLSVLPRGEATERARIEETLRRLRGAVSAQGSAGSEPIPEPPAPFPTKDEPELGARYVTRTGVADPAFWSVFAGAGAVLATGAVVGGMALKKDRDAADFVLGSDGTARERAALEDDADRLALVSDVSLGIGAATLTTALLLYLLRSETEEVMPSEVRAGLSGHHEGVMLTVSGAL